jgi:hypothetical protein
MVAEGLLLLSAFGFAWILEQPALGMLHLRATDALMGLGASVPLVVLFVWSLDSSWSPLATVREFLESQVRAFFGPWSWWQLAAVSLAAGVCEEVLFRGVLQTGLSRWLGPGAALVLASAAFGLCHCVNRAYAVLAGSLGAGLGGLMLCTDNLLTPIVTHTVYDFAALVWFLRVRQPKAQGLEKE